MNETQQAEFDQKKTEAKELQREYIRLAAIRPETDEINAQIRVIAGKFSKNIERMTELDGGSRIDDGYIISEWNE